MLIYDTLCTHSRKTNKWNSKMRGQIPKIKHVCFLLHYSYLNLCKFCFLHYFCKFQFNFQCILTAFGLIWAVDAVHVHVALVVRRYAVRLVPNVLAARQLALVAVWRRCNTQSTRNQYKLHHSHQPKMHRPASAFLYAAALGWVNNKHSRWIEHRCDLLIVSQSTVSAHRLFDWPTFPGRCTPLHKLQLALAPAYDFNWSSARLPFRVDKFWKMRSFLLPKVLKTSIT